MTWDEALDRLKKSGLHPIEETYMEHYGKILAVERPEFRGRNIRCTYGLIRLDTLRVEVFLFPSEGQLQDFLEIIGASESSPSWIASGNLLVHLPACDPTVFDKVAEALK
jgi:hypothetical protein